MGRRYRIPIIGRIYKAKRSLQMDIGFVAAETFIPPQICMLKIHLKYITPSTVKRSILDKYTILLKNAEEKQTNG